MIRTRSSHAWPALSLGTALVFSACTGPPAPPAPLDLDAVLDTDVPDAERTCLQQACAAVTTPQELAECRSTSCAPRNDAWSVLPERIRYDGEMAFVQARLSYEPGGYGEVDSPRSSEAYVGCTLITRSGEEIDLAVTTAFPADLERPFTLNTEVGGDVRDIIFGVWDRKVEPCDSERMGCQQYGFLLDGSLATWPPTVYTEGTRQRILPPTVSVQFVDAGAGAASLPAARDAVRQRLDAEIGVFGSTVDTAGVHLAEAHATTSRIAYADDHDALIAKRLAQAVPDAVKASAPVEVVHDADAQADFVIVLGGPASSFETASERCADARDDAYVACLAGE